MTDLSDGLILESQTEPDTGIRKRIEIHLSTDKPSIQLIHTLINDGVWAVELAPWAITQFRLGSAIILPMPLESADPAGLLPNRQLSFWPYASINPRLKLDDEFVLFNAEAASPFKMGYFNPHAWMAIGWTAFYSERHSMCMLVDFTPIIIAMLKHIATNSLLNLKVLLR